MLGGSAVDAEVNPNLLCSSELVQSDCLTKLAKAFNPMAMNTVIGRSLKETRAVIVIMYSLLLMDISRANYTHVRLLSHYNDISHPIYLPPTCPLGIGLIQQTAKLIAIIMTPIIQIDFA